jgi:hypothetical protein
MHYVESAQEMKTRARAGMVPVPLPAAMPDESERIPAPTMFLVRLNVRI